MAKALFRIIYSEEFINNLAKIYAYHASNFAQNKAERITYTALKKIALLKSHPRMFAKAESKKFPSCRKIAVEEYMVLYKVKEKSVVIINIIAGATDWKIK